MQISIYLDPAVEPCPGLSTLFPVLYLGNDFVEYECKSARTLPKDTCSGSAHAENRGTYLFFNICTHKCYVMYAYNSYN